MALTNAVWRLPRALGHVQFISVTTKAFHDNRCSCCPAHIPAAIPGARRVAHRAKVEAKLSANNIGCSKVHATDAAELWRGASPSCAHLQNPHVGRITGDPLNSQGGFPQNKLVSGRHSQGPKCADQPASSRQQRHLEKGHDSTKIRLSNGSCGQNAISTPKDGTRTPDSCRTLHLPRTARNQTRRVLYRRRVGTSPSTPCAGRRRVIVAASQA